MNQNSQGQLDSPLKLGNNPNLDIDCIALPYLTEDRETYIVNCFNLHRVMDNPFGNKKDEKT
uniref:Uncharacterized protein n=1 Tax=Manihot esculenta TaxID=3983 RepID=A0A2C9UMG2_MANES